MSEACFWVSTPFQTRQFIEAHGERQIAAYRLTMWGAWHAGVYARVKSMPSLDKALSGLDRRKRKPMTPEQMLAAFEMINVRSGGKDLRKTAH